MTEQQFQHFPMMMVHPNFQPATLGTSEDARKGTPATFGTAMKFPPVTVQNEQQREYHEAQGYVPGGKSNPAAFVQAHAAPDPMRHHGHQEFPKFVGEILVKNEDEERAFRWPWGLPLETTCDCKLTDIPKTRKPTQKGRPRRIAPSVSPLEKSITRQRRRCPSTGS